MENPRDPPWCGKLRRIRPFSRDSKRIRESRASRVPSSAKTPFAMTPFSVPVLKNQSLVALQGFADNSLSFLPCFGKERIQQSLGGAVGARRFLLQLLRSGSEKGVFGRRVPLKNVQFLENPENLEVCSDSRESPGLNRQFSRDSTEFRVGKDLAPLQG